MARFSSSTETGLWSISSPALLASRIRSGAVFATFQGNVLLAWGAVERPFRCHSVRKSLLSGLYGVHAGEIDLQKTIGELGIDDRQPLTETEKQARILDLLMARSGIYHPAAKETSDMDAERPQRGSHPPGTWWWYNNWARARASLVASAACDGR